MAELIRHDIIQINRGWESKENPKGQWIFDPGHTVEAELAARDKVIGEAIMFLQKLVVQYELGSALDIPGYIGRVVAKLEATVSKDKK